MKPVAKGKSFPDGTYIYTCGTCAGSGIVGANQDCPDCYGLNVPKIIEMMQKGARGQRYYGLLKAFLSVQGAAMVSECKAIKEREGKVSYVDLGYIALKFGLNFKATMEWLEECEVIRPGAYDRLIDDWGSKFKVKDLYAEARKKYPELEAES